MSKYAVQIKETLTRTIVIDEDTYEKAESICRKLYKDEDIQLHADNSSIEVEFSDDTENYKEIFDQEFYNVIESYEVSLARQKGRI